MHILCSVFFFSENRAVCEIIWKNFVELGGPRMTICNMPFCMLDTLVYKHTLAICNCNNGCRHAPKCYFIVHCLSCRKLNVDFLSTVYYMLGYVSPWPCHQNIIHESRRYDIGSHILYFSTICSNSLNRHNVHSEVTLPFKAYRSRDAPTV